MWHVVSSPWSRVGLAVLLIGWSIKLMDDYVDRELDQALGRANLTQRLGDGVPIYMAWAAVLAVYLAPAPATTMFLAAYAVGMGDQLGERYRAGWRAWVEVAITFLIGLMIEPRWFTLNLLLMVTVQITDDHIDMRHDHLTGKRTVATLYGPKLSLLAMVTMAMVALWQSPWYTVWVMVSAWLIAVVAEKVGTR